ncbi:MAG: FeoA domain-containing protein [Longimicrobiales bacterium]
MVTPNRATQSLAATQAGDVVLIQRILFEGLRTRCSELDIFEGETVRCRAGNASQLVLQTQRGRTVALDRDWARFIQVARESSVSVRP